MLDAPTPILRRTCIWHLGWRQCNAGGTPQRWKVGLEGLKRPGPFCWHRQVVVCWRRRERLFSRQAIRQETPESKGIGLFGHSRKRRGAVPRSMSVETVCLDIASRGGSGSGSGRSSAGTGQKVAFAIDTLMQAHRRGQDPCAQPKAQKNQTSGNCRMGEFGRWQFQPRNTSHI